MEFILIGILFIIGYIWTYMAKNIIISGLRLTLVLAITFSLSIGAGLARLVMGLL